jgi:hypothetical protein
MFVSRDFDKPFYFAAKGEVVGARMRALRDSGHYDFLFPLDCDEFVALRTETGFVASSPHIHNYLESLRGRPETLKIQNEFLNSQRCPGYYRLVLCNKTFYAAESFERTDHGFHLPGARFTDALYPTEIAHIHYHNKPFRRLRADARRKLKGLGVDTNDRRTLRDLVHSRHLVRYFFMTERELTDAEEAFPHIHQPEFLRLLGLLGARTTTLLQQGWGGQPVPPRLIPADFDSLSYLRANQDVARENFDALLHYSLYGYAEKRETGS